MATQRNWYTRRFSLLSNNCFLDHRQFLMYLFPYVIHCTVRRNRTNTTWVTIFILIYQLDLSHISTKFHLLLLGNASEMIHQPCGLQGIITCNKNREFCVIQNAFKWQLNVVAYNNRYTQALDGIKKSARSGGVPSWMQTEFWCSHPSNGLLSPSGIGEAFFHDNTRLINQQVPQIFSYYASLSTIMLATT